MTEEEAAMVDWLINGPLLGRYERNGVPATPPPQLPKLVAAGEMLRRVIAERDQIIEGTG